MTSNASTPSWTGIVIHNRQKDVVGIALVDWEDRELGQHRWCLHGKGYAHRRKGGHNYLMHRVILGLERGDPRQADHINGDRLDNRRANLRIVSHAQNRQNVAALGGTSRHRGVTWRPRRRKWEARGWQNGRNVYLGSFDTEDEAAAVVADWRAVHMPFANEDRHAA